VSCELIRSYRLVCRRLRACCLCRGIERDVLWTMEKSAEQMVDPGSSQVTVLVIEYEFLGVEPCADFSVGTRRGRPYMAPC
jgi:hypothetical protein